MAKSTFSPNAPLAVIPDRICHCLPLPKAKRFFALGSAQPIEKARSRQENPRKSKPWGTLSRVAAIYFAI
jgi:hypothetical protein